MVIRKVNPLFNVVTLSITVPVTFIPLSYLSLDNQIT